MPYKEPVGEQSHAPERDALVTEEPDVLSGHVRICGGPGGQPLGLPGSGRPTAAADFGVMAVNGDRCEQAWQE